MYRETPPVTKVLRVCVVMVLDTYEFITSTVMFLGHLGGVYFSQGCVGMYI